MKKYFSRLLFGWKTVARKIGNFQINVVFSLFYFFLIFPLGFIVSLFKDYLERKSTPSWQKIEDSFGTLEELKAQS